ncbi:MAG: hypothetical protein GX326_05950 [Clostridiaceae bacterium]|nr:hypothetical protein [Clostridiaceae bacterium]
MKRLIRLMVILFSLIVLLTACEDIEWSSTQKTEPEPTEQTRFEELPVTIRYEDTSFDLINVEMFENEYEYLFNQYFIFTLDVSNLSEKQQHFLNKEDIDYSISMKYDDERYSLHSVKRILFNDDSVIKIYVISTHEGFRETAPELELNFEVWVKKEDREDIIKYTYKETIKAPFKNSDSMSQTDELYFIQGLNERREFFEGLFD